MKRTSNAFETRLKRISNSPQTHLIRETALFERRGESGARKGETGRARGEEGRGGKGGSDGEREGEKTRRAEREESGGGGRLGVCRPGMPCGPLRPKCVAFKMIEEGIPAVRDAWMLGCLEACQD